ncbi:MAG: hypothetical protein GWP04_02045 [Gammaproteobacteria bacterium]|nr:hypothetical protein [Gammaproteobacteria bacterium]
MTEFWRRWLIVAAGVTALAGFGFAASTAAGATGILGAIFDFVYLPGELQAPAGEVASFAIGVAGAVMMGWAAMMLILLGGRSTSALPSTWWALTVGLLVWFVVDVIVSITSGAIGNVVLNVVFLALFTPPLIATRPGRGSAATGGASTART